MNSIVKEYEDKVISQEDDADANYDVRLHSSNGSNYQDIPLPKSQSPKTLETKTFSATTDTLTQTPPTNGKISVGEKPYDSTKKFWDTKLFKWVVVPSLTITASAVLSKYLDDRHVSGKQDTPKQEHGLPEEEADIGKGGGRTDEGPIGGSRTDKDPIGGGRR